MKKSIKLEQKDVGKISQERDSYKQRYLRALADYQNFENRARTESERTAKNTTAALLTRLLPLLDDLEKAEVFIKDEGLKMIKDQFKKRLTEEGLQEVDVLGKPFDPQFAEAIEVVSGDRDNTVVEVVQKGYKFNDRLIRPAQVKVSKKAYGKSNRD